MQREEAKLARRLGAALKQARVARRLSQADLAERIDASTNYISLIERGQRLPATPMLVRLARAVGRSVDALLGERIEDAPDPGDAWVLEAFNAVPAPIQPYVLAMIRAARRPALDKLEPRTRVRRPKKR